jgi:quinohemoprotein ethanol dehydrogenase
MAVPAIALTTLWAVALQQSRRIDNNALRNAGNSTEWLTYGHDYSEQRYSPLRILNPENAARLGPAWSYEVGPGGGSQSATPLFANGVLYGVTNWSIAFAVDARTGKEIWRHDPGADRNTRLCCGVISRGVALYEDKVILPVIDGRMQGLDAATGKLLWSVWVTPERKEGYLSPYSITMAPRVANGKIFMGVAGAEFVPFRGYVTAHDVNSGKELWRFYTVPGDPSKPFESKAMEVAAKTWTGEWYKYGGGGSIWDGMAYDPDLNLLYVGTANGLPWPQELRQGKDTPKLDNLYVASIIALDGNTGELKWHYQCTPGDEWDYDAIQHLMLANLRINGRDRRVVMQVNKNGYFYVIDRTNGEYISAEPVARVSWARGMDSRGRPLINPEAYYSSQRGVTVQPLQTHNTSQMAFNPATGLVYVPIAPEQTYNFVAVENFTPATTRGPQDFGIVAGRGGGNPVPMSTPPAYGPQRNIRGGILSAWDPVTQKERWFTPSGGNRDGGVVSTASNLVIQTTPNGQLLIYTADKGEKLHELPIGQTGGVGPPITYALDGKQYIAVMAGSGAGRGRGAPPAPAEPTTAAAQRGAAQPTVPAQPQTGGTGPRLYVFTVDPTPPAN